MDFILEINLPQIYHKWIASCLLIPRPLGTPLKGGDAKRRREVSPRGVGDRVPRSRNEGPR